MMPSRSSFLLAVAAFFISTTNAGPDEIVFLNDCVAPDGHLFSTAAYFGVPPSGGSAPDAIAQTDSTPGQIAL